MFRSAALALFVACVVLAGCGQPAQPTASNPAPPGPDPRKSAPDPEQVPPKAPTPSADGFRELTPKEAEKYPSGALMEAVEPADTWELRPFSSEAEMKKDDELRKSFVAAVKGLSPAKAEDRVKIREAAVKAFGKEKAEKMGVLLRVDGNPKYVWP